MADTKPFTRMLYILTLVMSEMITTAYMFPETMVHADSIGQTTTPTDQLAMLSKRMNELEDIRSQDVIELNKRVHKLSDLRENDLREFTRLNQHVEELQRLRVQDLYVTTMLTQRIEELERHCDKEEQVVSDISKQIPISPHDETPYHNTSEVTLSYRAAPTPDDTKTKKEDMSTHVRTPSSKTSERLGRIQSRNNRITRVSPSDDIVAFHAILTHQITGPATNHLVKYNHLITNTGGVQYSTNTGVFTCTQSGVHFFSWSILVGGNHYIRSELVRNSAVIGSGITGQHTNYESTGSTTAVSHLEVGDEVWVRVAGHQSGSNIYPSQSMFAGFRLP